MANDSTRNVLELVYQWDFFLSHAGADLDPARNLYGVLSPQAKVFLDDVSLLPGDDWDMALTSAQQGSLISVILISPNTEAAYYQREEIAAAIQMARQDPKSHRVVPVYINTDPAKSSPAVHFGLRLKHSLRTNDPSDFSETGKRLLETLGVMKHYEEKKNLIVGQQRQAVAKLTSSGINKDVLIGFHEVTQFIRPLLYTLLTLFIVMTLVLIISLFTPTELQGLIVATSGSLCALLLACILWLIGRSLNYAPQIAQGYINGG